MSQTVIYVRVSTEDQVDFSPDAQEKRCRELAKQRGLSGVEVLADEGCSGKNLDRPAMQQLLAGVGEGRVRHVVIWSLDRLSRDQGDFDTLVKLFNLHEVRVHSVNEGDLDLGTASGRLQVGIHGVFAQYQREHIVENVHMGMRQAAEQGRWQNRAPTGYDMVDGELRPNGDAPLVRRAFELRAAGCSLRSIEEELGLKMSTVRHLLQNRVYLGETRLRERWFPGIHEPLVTLQAFDAAQRGHIPGRRRSRDLLSGIVRCGLCGRVAGVEYNERNQRLYRCRHRGQGCQQPRRAASGLLRAAQLGLRLLQDSADLRAAIREHLAQEHHQGALEAPSVAGAIASLEHKHRKLLDLYYGDHIDPERFAHEERRLLGQLQSLREQQERAAEAAKERAAAVGHFDEVATMIEDLDLEALWDEATEAERRVLVEELIESICIYPDQLTVQVVGAPAFIVALDEVGLRAGTRPLVSEVRLGREGYARIHQAGYDNARYLAAEISALGPFEMLSDGSDGIPGLAWKLREDVEHPFTLFDLADRLRTSGWQVPAYTLPPEREDLVVQRILVRHDFSRDLADLLLEDYRRALQHFARHPITTPMTPIEAAGFHH